MSINLETIQINAAKTRDGIIICLRTSEKILENYINSYFYIFDCLQGELFWLPQIIM